MTKTQSATGGWALAKRARGQKQISPGGHNQDCFTAKIATARKEHIFSENTLRYLAFLSAQRERAVNTDDCSALCAVPLALCESKLNKQKKPNKLK